MLLNDFFQKYRRDIEEICEEPDIQEYHMSGIVTKYINQEKERKLLSLITKAQHELTGN